MTDKHLDHDLTRDRWRFLRLSAEEQHWLDTWRAASLSPKSCGFPLQGYRFAWAETCGNRGRSSPEQQARERGLAGAVRDNYYGGTRVFLSVQYAAQSYDAYLATIVGAAGVITPQAQCAQCTGSPNATWGSNLNNNVHQYAYWLRSSNTSTLGLTIDQATPVSLNATASTIGTKGVMLGGCESGGECGGDTNFNEVILYGADESGCATSCGSGLTVVSAEEKLFFGSP